MIACFSAPAEASGSETMSNGAIARGGQKKTKKHLTSKSLTSCTSVDPFCEVVAGGEGSIDLGGRHALVFGQILGILPLEEFDAILRDRLPSKVAVRSGLLVLRLPKRKRDGNGSWAAVELHLDALCDIVRCQVSLFCTISLDKERKGLCDADCVRKLDERTLA